MSIIIRDRSYDISSIARRISSVDEQQKYLEELAEEHQRYVENISLKTPKEIVQEAANRLNIPYKNMESFVIDLEAGSYYDSDPNLTVEELIDSYENLEPF